MTGRAVSGWGIVDGLGVAAGRNARGRRDSCWTPARSCLLHVDGNLPAIAWTRVPFHQEGDRLSGLYTFTDHFKHQNSVVFSGTLSGQSARTSVTAIRANGSPNFTAEVSGTPAMMTGPMMSGMSRRPVRSCTLALRAA